MTEQKHTPGPWVYDEAAKAIYSHGPSRGLSGNSEDCSIVVEIKDIYLPRQANARLIAAAPDLLAACKEMLGLIDPQKDWTQNDRLCAINHAKAAIAKAEPNN